ncbi:MAG: serine/threonine protein kinase, partial [Planctomycetes bacterium]|nr:serine/threonine protein kinase [Planctomycetota bacterium]
KIGLQVADALAHAHSRGILHQDIKPANLLIDYHNIVYVTDFGLAKAVQAGDATQTAGITGTLRYISPEQFQGRTDARSDIYGLGLTLYELLALRPAYEGPDRNTLINRINTSDPVRLGKLNRRIPRDLETIVQKAIARNPDNRYQYVREFGEDLKCFLEDRPIRARRVGSIERFWRWSRRNPAIASLTAATMFLIVLAAIVATTGYINTNRALIGQEIERERAQANADLAMKALNRMFERFNPNQITAVSGLTVDKGEGITMLIPTPPVLSGEVAELLKDMLTFYRRIANAEPYDHALRQRIARANERVGSIRQLLGLHNLAASSYKRAIYIYRMRYGDLGQEDSFMLESARIYNSLGQLYLSTGSRNDACVAHLEALRALQPNAGTISDRPAIRYELARTHYLLGSGGYDDLDASSLDEGQDSTSAGESSRPGQLSPVTINRLELEARQREPDVHLQTAIEIMEGLLAEDADNPDYHLITALCHRNMSSMFSQGDPYVAGGSLTTATVILEKLVVDHPEMPDYRYHLAETYATFDLKEDLSESSYQVIEDRLNKALAISEGLSAEYPDIPHYTVSQAHIYHHTGTIMQRTLRWDEAERNYQKSARLYKALVGRFPDTVSYKVRLAAFRLTLANLLVRDQRLAEVRSILKDSIKMLSEIPSSSSNRQAVDELLAQTRQAFELAGGEDTQKPSKSRKPGDGSGILKK